MLKSFTVFYVLCTVALEIPLHKQLFDSPSVVDYTKQLLGACKLRQMCRIRELVHAHVNEAPG